MSFPIKVAPFNGDLDPHILYMLPSAHQSPNPKRHLDRFSRFCTVHGRVLVHFTTSCPFPPLKLPLPIGNLDPLLTHDSLGPFEPTTQTAYRSV